LTEISHFGVPSILIPYPFAADDHQTWNAKIFEKAGAAELLPQKDVAGDVIARKVLSLLDDPARLEAMSSRCAQLSPGAAAERIADVMIRHCL
jgi:UDP-N-acetylglucosamine--N-acetylmuramyl-(pentapeptide) pyrophosphoryl-undecaprenol N-acetylglucosamine transferase